MGFKININGERVTLGLLGYKIIYYASKQNKEKSYREIGNDLNISRERTKAMFQYLIKKGLITQSKNLTSNGTVILKSLNKKVKIKKKRLKRTRQIIENLDVSSKKFPSWFQKAINSKEYASYVLLLSIDFEGSISSNVTTIYQTGRMNSQLLFLLSFIAHHHSLTPKNSDIISDLQNGWFRLSVAGLKDVYRLGGPLGNLDKDKNAIKTTKIRFDHTKPGWYNFIIKNNALELIALAMEEEFMIKNLCLRLKVGDPTQYWMYNLCKNLNLVTYKSRNSMKKYNGFQLKIEALPEILDKANTFVINHKNSKIKQMLSIHAKNKFHSHRLSSNGIDIKKITLDIIKCKDKWLLTKDVYKEVNSKFKVSQGLVLIALENLYQNNLISKSVTVGRSFNWKVNQWRSLKV